MTGSPDPPTLVLVHGLAILRRADRMFTGLPEALAARGFRVTRALVQGDGSLAGLSRRLAERLQAIDGPLALLCHSMGGLQARQAILDDALAVRVRAIATVGSPHAGTPLARAGKLFNRAYRDLTPAARARWQEEHGEAERAAIERHRIRRLCAIARLTGPAPSPSLRAPHALLRLLDGPSDGLVPATSQAWGEVVVEASLDHLQCAMVDATQPARDRAVALWMRLAEAATDRSNRDETAAVATRPAPDEVATRTGDGERNR